MTSLNFADVIAWTRRHPWLVLFTLALLWNVAAYSFECATLPPVRASGGTWTQQTNSGSRYWSTISSSSDGLKLVAAAPGAFDSGCLCFLGDYIYTSTDSGATWTQRTGSGLLAWSSVAASSDATKLVAADSGTTGSNGYLYTSADSGATWTQRTGPGSNGWSAVTSSSDGTKLAAINNFDGYVYTSTDTGANWTQQSGSSGHTWVSLASSADGSKLAAGDIGSYNFGCFCFSGGYVYTSTDSGATWTQRTNSGARAWRALSSSSDGVKLAAANYNSGYIYTSTDSGATWTEQTNAGSRSWRHIASSADGTKLAAVDSTPGYIWTNTDCGGVGANCGISQNANVWWYEF